MKLIYNLLILIFCFTTINSDFSSYSHNFFSKNIFTDNSFISSINFAKIGFYFTIFLFVKDNIFGIFQKKEIRYLEKNISYVQEHVENCTGNLEKYRISLLNVEQDAKNNRRYCSICYGFIKENCQIDVVLTRDRILQRMPLDRILRRMPLEEFNSLKLHDNKKLFDYLTAAKRANVMWVNNITDFNIVTAYIESVEIPETQVKEDLIQAEKELIYYKEKIQIYEKELISLKKSRPLFSIF